MSFDYSRKHQWKITPKGTGTRKPILFYTTSCREVKGRDSSYAWRESYMFGESTEA
jgi:hypothetical protein